MYVFGIFTNKKNTSLKNRLQNDFLKGKNKIKYNFGQILP